jgi:hypothetical protein
MKSNSAQAMGEVVAIAFEKANPHHCELVDMLVVGDPCILAPISFLFEVFEVGKDCHGSCFWFC